MQVWRAARCAQRGPPGIGRNKPPTISDENLAEQPLETVIWVAASELRAQAEAPSTEKTRVQKAVGVLIGLMQATGHWVGRKLDMVVDGAATAFGKALGAAGGVAGVASLTQHQDKLAELVEAALRWLSLL